MKIADVLKWYIAPPLFFCYNLTNKRKKEGLIMKGKKKGLAIGTSDFRELITEYGFYVDKTKFIEEILEDLSKVKLFTRPRRFGKTLNLSMLKYFFDVENAEENRKLFDNLYISQSEYMKYQGQYPVIFISMRNVEAENWEKSYFNTRRTSK